MLIPISVIFFLLNYSFCYSQKNNAIDTWEVPFKVTRINDKIDFDGVPDELFWEGIENLSFTMYTPNFGKAPTEKAIVKMAYDDRYFYVSAWLYYKNLDDIRGIGKKRDYRSFSTDWLGVLLDSFNDKENAFLFYTNINAVRLDGSVKNDLINNSDLNFNWNTFWDVKTVRHNNGWSAEIRIPFSSLRFQITNNKTQMGILLLRSVVAKQETTTWPKVSKLIYPFWKPSLCKVIEFEGLRPQNPLYITPYATAGAGQISKLNENATKYKTETTFKKDIGLDIKYGLTNNLTADITINTDFAQVEADNQMINLSRLSLYFPENRDFFQEKSDVFDFSLSGYNNLFYSRRIGLYKGFPVRIYGGLRLTGRIGKWDVGFLDMQTAKFEENPSENFGVVRFKRSMPISNSYVGSMVTSRLGMNGSYNFAYGIDGRFRLLGDEYLTLKWAQSFQNNYSNNIFDPKQGRFVFNWERRKEVGFNYDLNYSWAGKNFNPGIGFEMKQDFHGPRASLKYGWMPTDGDAYLRLHKISLSSFVWWNTGTWEHETTNSEIMWDFDSKNGLLDKGYIGINRLHETLSKDLIIGNNQSTIPKGEYFFTNLNLGFETSKAHPLSTVIKLLWGQFYDGKRFSFYIMPDLKIGSGFEISPSYNFDRCIFPERNNKFNNHIMRLDGLMSFTSKISASAFIQFNTAIDMVISNIRFRYNPREGNDLYIVYDQRINTDRSRIIPKLPFSAGNTILLKYTYTFRK